MTRTTYCLLTRQARDGGPHLDSARWHRTVTIQYDWSDGNEAGLERIWAASRAAYLQLCPDCPPDQILEIGRY